MNQLYLALVQGAETVGAMGRGGKHGAAVTILLLMGNHPAALGD